MSEEDLKKLQADWPNCVQVGQELTRSAEAQGLLFPFESLQVLQTSAVTGQNVHEAFEQLSLAVQDALCRHFTWQE